MSLIITATEYQARVLKAQGRSAVSFRHFAEKKLADQGIVFLSSFAEQNLWFEAAAGLAFSNKEALVAECVDAFHTMLLYEISLEELYGFDVEGVMLFRKLLKRFMQKKTPTFLEALQHLQVDEAIELFGFVDLPPLYRKVGMGPLMTGTEGMKMAEVYQAPNPETEFLQALSEIERLWQEHPNKTFALVVQQHTLSWSKIYRLLKTRQMALRISCSKNEVLAEQPKLLFLKDLFASVTTTDLLLISRVLISPFWPDDMMRRAHLDVWMRENMLRAISLAEVLKNLLFKDPGIQNTQWFQTWTKLVNFKEEAVAEFAEAFLSAAAMTSIIPVDAGAEKVNLHIVGVLEAVDLPVDVVWLLSADSEHYPLRKSAPAFLPKSLLIRKGVPISTEATQAYGQKLFTAITMGKEVYASFVPKVRGEQKYLSEFIKVENPILRHPEAILQSKIELRVQPSVGNKAVLANDDWILCSATRPQDDVIISGGTQLLKEQAECPFRAFAHFRLRVKELGRGRELLDPMQKGLLVHAALEKIWNELQSQQALLQCSEAERQDLVQHKVDEVLASKRSQLLKKLERDRLVRILAEWLSLEATRPPFQVDACELKELVSIGGLQLRLRLDRVDRIGQNRVIIDYKTGEISSKGWFEERLREPQLPLYVVTSAAEGAIFASLKVGKMGYAGVVKDSECAFDQVKALKGWDQQTAKWQSQLEGLATEFSGGHAAVAPIDDKVCLYCDLSTFCRIKEQGISNS